MGKVGECIPKGFIYLAHGLLTIAFPSFTHAAKLVCCLVLYL